MNAIGSTSSRWSVAAAGALAALALGAGAASAATTPKPTAKTGGVGDVKGTAGQLEGTVDPDGLETSYFFEYGASTKPYPSKTKPVALGKGTATIKVGQPVTGLFVGEHYRIVATYIYEGKTETVVGADKTFKGGKASKLRFNVERGKENRKSVSYGNTLELTGSLGGNGNEKLPLSLQATPFPYTETFTTLPGSILTGRGGQFLFRVAGLHRTSEFRIFTNTTRPLYSPVITVYVTPHILLHVHPLGHDKFHFYGTVRPLMRNTSIAIQQLRPQRASSKREGPATHVVGSGNVTRVSGSESRFSVIVTGLTGNYNYQASIRLTRGPLSSGSSNHVLVKAPKTAPATKRTGSKKKRSK